MSDQEQPEYCTLTKVSFEKYQAESALCRDRYCLSCRENRDAPINNVWKLLPKIPYKGELNL